MSMPLTELARTEMLLREQLARARAAEWQDEAGRRAAERARLARLADVIGVRSAQASVQAFLAELFSKPQSVRRLEAGIAALRQRRAARRAGKTRTDRLEELHALLDARRSHHLPLRPSLDHEPPVEGPSVAAAANDSPRRFAALRLLTGRGGKTAPRGQSRRRSSLFDAVRREDALGELFPQEVRSASRQEPLVAAPRRETGRLPNLSGPRANKGAMKDMPERDWGPPPSVQFPMPAKKDDRRSDLLIAGLGVALGLTCALFPWYIFFNQDQFGVQAIRFGGRGQNAGRATIDARPGGGGTPLAGQEIPDSALDLFSTGTLQLKPESADRAPGLEQQPFPAEATEFRLVHIANGRAMIEDNAGLWVVQKGSVLPDSSVVRSIEKRNGRWVLVTSTDRVIEISK